MTPLPDSLLESVAAAAVREGLADAIFTRLHTPIGRAAGRPGPRRASSAIAFEEEPEDRAAGRGRRRARPARDRLRPRARRRRATRCRRYLEGDDDRARRCPSTCGSSHAPFRRAVLETLHARCRAGETVTLRRARRARRQPEGRRARSARRARATRSRSSCPATACCPARAARQLRRRPGAQARAARARGRAVRLATRLTRRPTSMTTSASTGWPRRFGSAWMPPILSTTSWPSVTLPSSA